MKFSLNQFRTIGQNLHFDNFQIFEIGETWTTFLILIDVVDAWIGLSLGSALIIFVSILNEEFAVTTLLRSSRSGADANYRPILSQQFSAGSSSTTGNVYSSYYSDTTVIVRGLKTKNDGVTSNWKWSWSIGTIS